MDENYIKTSSSRSLKENKERTLHNKFVFTQDPLPEDIDLDYVLEHIERRIPIHLFHLIDSILIGDFNFLNKRDINASYMDGAIYVTNRQHDEGDMIDDIVHELAHSVEELYRNDIYIDQSIEEEFLGKRKRLCNILSSEGAKVPMTSCLESEYNKSFDEFLYKDVGYEKLVSLTMGLFNSPYAATSLREYFANGFEAYFIGDRKYLQNISPFLYKKLDQLNTYNKKQEF